MPELEAPAVPETPAAAAEPAKSSWAVGDSADPNPVGPDPEKQAERFTKFHKNLNRELRDREERKRQDPFGPRRDPLAEPEPEEPRGMSPEQYLEWRKTGKVPEAEQAQSAEGAQAGESQQKAATPGEEILASARTHGEHVEQETKALLDAFRGNAAELRGLEKTLALVQHAQDFPQIVTKLSEPFFADAATTREGAQRTKELQEDLADVSNSPEVHLQLLRIPDAAKQMLNMSREQRKQAVVNISVGLKINEARGGYADFDKVALPAAEQIAKTHPVVAEAIGKSRHMAHMLYVIGQSPEETAQFVNLARTDPLGAVKKVALYDYLISQELLGEKGSLQSLRESGAAPVPLRKPSPPAKQITTAPPPSTEIGGKMQRAPDALDRALKDGDVQAYARELRRQAREGRG